MEDGQDGSYLELVKFLQRNGAKGQIAHDLAQLFRRVVFNVAVPQSRIHSDAAALAFIASVQYKPVNQ